MLFHVVVYMGHNLQNIFEWLVLFLCEATLHCWQFVSVQWVANQPDTFRPQALAVQCGKMLSCGASSGEGGRFWVVLAGESMLFYENSWVIQVYTENELCRNIEGLVKFHLCSLLFWSLLLPGHLRCILFPNSTCPNGVGGNRFSVVVYEQTDEINLKNHVPFICYLNYYILPSSLKYKLKCHVFI